MITRVIKSIFNKPKIYSYSCKSFEQFCNPGFIPSNRKKYKRKKTNNNTIINKNKTSYGEKIILNYLLTNKITHTREKEFYDCFNPQTKINLRFDFFLPQYNTCIEFDGKQHFKEATCFHGDNSKKELLSQIQRDLIKTNYCKLNNINLIRIPYYSLYKIKSILQTKLNTNFIPHPPGPMDSMGTGQGSNCMPEIMAINNGKVPLLK